MWLIIFWDHPTIVAFSRQNVAPHDLLTYRHSDNDSSVRTIQPFLHALSVSASVIYAFFVHLSLLNLNLSLWSFFLWLLLCLLSAPLYFPVDYPRLFVSFVGASSRLPFSVFHSTAPDDVNVWWPAEGYDSLVFNSHKKHIKKAGGGEVRNCDGNRKTGDDIKRGTDIEKSFLFPATLATYKFYKYIFAFCIYLKITWPCIQLNIKPTYV